MSAKVYSKSLHSEEVFKKIIDDFNEKSPDFFTMDLILNVEEMSVVFLNKGFQKEVNTRKIFKDYVLIVMQQNMDSWKDEPNIKERFEAFKISQHFIENKEILNLLVDFEKLIST